MRLAVNAGWRSEYGTHAHAQERERERERERENPCFKCEAGC